MWWGTAEPVRPTPRPLAKQDLGKRLLGMQGGAWMVRVNKLSRRGQSR